MPLDTSLYKLCSDGKRSYETDYIPVKPEEEIWSFTETAHVTDNHFKKYMVQALLCKTEGCAVHMRIQESGS